MEEYQVMLVLAGLEGQLEVVLIQALQLLVGLEAPEVLVLSLMLEGW